MTMTCSGQLQVDQPTKRWRLALKPNRSGFGLEHGLTWHAAIGSILQRVAAEAGGGGAGADGGSDPGLRRLVPPQTFPCSCRRSGGRYRRPHYRKQVVFTIKKEDRMPLINKKHVTERETASYKLDRATVELVRLYAEFIG